jgi:hypothetical protein
MNDLTQKYLDKELVDSIPEKLPPDYEENLLCPSNNEEHNPTAEQLEQMAKDQADGYALLCKKLVF